MRKFPGHNKKCAKVVAARGLGITNAVHHQGHSFPILLSLTGHLQCVACPLELLALLRVLGWVSQMEAPRADNSIPKQPENHPVLQILLRIRGHVLKAAPANFTPLTGQD